MLPSRVENSLTTFSLPDNGDIGYMAGMVADWHKTSWKCILSDARSLESTDDARSGVTSNVIGDGQASDAGPNENLAESYQYRMRLAYSRKDRPWGVRDTSPLLRLKSLVPKSFSSSDIFWLTAGWLMPSSAAARVKFPVRDNVMNTCSLKSPNISANL